MNEEEEEELLVFHRYYRIEGPNKVPYCRIRGAQQSASIYNRGHQSPGKGFGITKS
jgi:hypothetical protein